MAMPFTVRLYTDEEHKKNFKRENNTIETAINHCIFSYVDSKYFSTRHEAMSYLTERHNSLTADVKKE